MTPSQQPPAERRAFDVICLGRLAVDLYAQQLGARLEDVASMAKYLGGSSANIAFGCDAGRERSRARGAYSMLSRRSAERRRQTAAAG